LGKSQLAASVLKAAIAYFAFANVLLRIAVRTAGSRRYPTQYIFGELGVISLSALPRAPA
jgi:hypothetical protein